MDDNTSSDCMCYYEFTEYTSMPKMSDSITPIENNHRRKCSTWLTNHRLCILPLIEKSACEKALFRCLLPLCHRHTWTGCTFSWSFSLVILLTQNLDDLFTIVRFHLENDSYPRSRCCFVEQEPAPAVMWGPVTLSTFHYAFTIVFVFQELFLAVMIGFLD